MIKLIGIFLIILLFVYILLGVGLYFAQRQLIYYPQPFIQDRYPELTLDNEVGPLTVICLNTTEDCQPLSQRAVLYFGGNAEAVIQSAPLLQRIISADTAIYLVNYRGFGESPGKPSESALVRDALTVYDAIYQQLQSTLPPSSNSSDLIDDPPHSHSQSHSQSQRPITIDVIGRSIGTGVATALASQRPVRRLALITPFDSLVAVAQDTFWFYPLSLLLKDTYRSDQRAAQISSQVLLLVAGRDEIIPPRHAEQLRLAFNQTVEYETIDSATHNDIMSYPKAQLRLQQFMH